MVLKQFSLVSKKEGERENQYGRWGKLQGLERRKGIQAIEAEECVLLVHTLFGYSEASMTFEKLHQNLVFRDMQYTDFLLQDIYTGQDTL